jgi:hypothetical protein
MKSLKKFTNAQLYRFNLVKSLFFMRIFKKEIYNSILQIVNSQIGYTNMRVPAYKNLSVIKFLNRFQPKYILELGSGTTTATFLNYTKYSNSRLLALESDMNWINLLNKKLKFQQNNAEILHRTVEQGQGFTRFDLKDLNLTEIDFVYCDGPPLDSSKEYNRCVIDLLEQGHYPQVIIVDARYKTVDAIHEYMTRENLKYKLTVARNYNGEKLLVKHSDPRHSVFERIPEK